MTAPRGIGEVLAAARARLDRLDPVRADALVKQGAILIDTRPAQERAADGTIPGALWIERNFVEWRLDPTSDGRVPQAANTDITWILFSTEGYSSSLAAASLKDLGLHRATDLDGGIRAWKAAGLPTAPVAP